MSATDKLIDALRSYGLYPFVYSTAYGGPGAIIGQKPHYVVEGSIFDPVYAPGGGANPFLHLKDGAQDRVPEYDAEIANLYAKHSFSNKSEVSVAYGGAKLDAALDTSFDTEMTCTVRPLGLVEHRYPSMTPDSLAAAFTSVANEPPSTALGQLVDRMKRRWKTPNRPRPLDIADFVLLASKLELEFTTDTKYGAKLQLQLQKAVAASENALSVGVTTTGASFVSVKATWDSGEKLPVLWYPWRYGWDLINHRFVTGRV